MKDQWIEPNLGNEWYEPQNWGGKWKEPVFSGIWPSGAWRENCNWGGRWREPKME